MTSVKFNQQYTLWLFGLLFLGLVAAALFGFAGFRTIIAVALIFVMPPLFVLKNSNLDIEEKIFFSLFIGLGLFALLAWSINWILPSFKLSVIAAFALVAAAAFFLPLILSKLQKKQQ